MHSHATELRDRIIITGVTGRLRHSATTRRSIRLAAAVTGQSQLSVLIGVTIVKARTGNRLFHCAAVFALFLLGASVATFRASTASAQPNPPHIEEWGDPDHPSSSADQKGSAPAGGEDQQDQTTQTGRLSVQVSTSTSTTVIPSWFVVRTVIVSFVRTVSPWMAMSRTY